MNFITATVYSLKDICAVVSIVMIMQHIFLERVNFGKIKACVFGAAVLLNAFIGVFVLMKHDPAADETMDFVSNVICILCVRVFTDEKRLGRTIWIVMLYLMTADMFFSLFSDFMPDRLWAECVFDIIVFLSVSVLIYFFAKKTAFNFLPKVFDEIPKWVFVAIMLFDLSCYYKQFGFSESWYNAFYILSSVMVVLCVVYLLFRIFIMSYEQNKAIVQIQQQSAYYSEKLSSQSELRSFRHDYKNHMIVVDSYLKNGEIELARQYLATLNENVHASLYSISTGNFVADAVVNNKMTLAKSKGIDFRFSGFVPESVIEPQDLCQIFSNLLDNAIEACEKQENEKLIEVSATVKNSNFVFTVTNTCSSTPKKKNGIFITSKKDKANHGTGLKNVKSVAEKYGGDFITECENGVFTADVRLQIKQKITN